VGAPWSKGFLAVTVRLVLSGGAVLEHIVPAAGKHPRGNCCGRDRRSIAPILS